MAGNQLSKIFLHCVTRPEQLEWDAFSLAALHDRQLEALDPQSGGQGERLRIPAARLLLQLLLTWSVQHEKQEKRIHTLSK